MVPPTVRRRVFVTGKVQGVWFRQSTVDEAERIGGLRGWVRNRDDGRVEAVVEGSEGAVERLVGWVRRGPPNARVDALEVVDEPPSGHERPFHVAR